MCTAISYKTNCHYFGRNLDLEYRYCETVTITPRNYPFSFSMGIENKQHYAMIGIAFVMNGYPLYYEATNEHGLSMAGLNFPGNAKYLAPKEGYRNVAPYEFVPWILGQYKTVSQVRKRLTKINLVNIPFSAELATSPLHWMISDCNESIVVEPTDNGIKVYENPIGVLTNNPPFDFQLYNLSNYLNLTHDEPENRFANGLQVKPYSRGMGAIGLPGDLSSASRFIRAAFTKCNSVSEDSEESSVGQFFHILESVSQQNGCVRVENGFVKTVYSCCCNTDKCIYYYTTYENRQITAVSLFHTDLNASTLTTFPLIDKQQVRHEN